MDEDAAADPIVNRLLAFLLVAAVFAQESQRHPDAPLQPVPYSHKQHVAMGLTCKDCHAMPDPGELMGIPEAAKCMSCHRSIKTDSPAIQKLARFARERREILWVRVYQIPSYVDFSHKVHIEAGAGCETCHGAVAQRDQLWRETDISMAGCMNCHRQRKASLACRACHEELR